MLNWHLLCALLLFLTVGIANGGSMRGISLVAKDPATGQLGRVDLYQKSYAVIIGIDKYKNLPQDRQLTYAVKDAKGVEQVLRTSYRFDKIFTLYDEQATRINIMSLLTKEIRAEITKEDSLFVFWAGHGNQEGQAGSEVGYLIPHDGDTEQIYSNITMTEIRDTISKILPAKHVFYVMDACYSGLLTDTRSVDSTPKRNLDYLKEITKENVRQVLTAGGKNEEVLDGGPKRHSVFTGRLIEILEARGDFITANELQTLIKEKVFGDAQAQGKAQTPGYGKLSGSGDYVFVPSKEYILEQQRQEQQKRAEDIDKVKKEQDRLARDIEVTERLEKDALAAKDEAKIRKQKEEVARLAGLNRLAVIKQQQLEDDQKRQAQQQAELAKIEEERKRKLEEAAYQEEQLKLQEAGRQSELARLELEQKQKQKEEENRLAPLKAELEAKRKKALAVADVLSIDAAVAEIKEQAARIEEIRKEFQAEQDLQAKTIEDQYQKQVALLDKAKEVRRLKKAQNKLSTTSQTPDDPTIAPQDEFESKAKYFARVEKTKQDYRARKEAEEAVRKKSEQAEEDSYSQGMAQAKNTRERSLSDLKARIDNETSLAIKPFQDRVAFLQNREYTLTGDAVEMQLGKYDAERELFPVNISNSTSTVQFASNGEIHLSHEAARTFKQQYLSGLVRAEVVCKPIENRCYKFALINEAEGTRFKNKRGIFLKERSSSWVGSELLPEMVLVVGGCFQMGSNDNGDENPIHTVCVGDFSLGKYEVTQGQWNSLMSNHPSSIKGNDLPVENVKWSDAQTFIEKLNTSTGKRFRLPTEAEWEYAARGGKFSGGYRYSGSDSLKDVAWFDKNSENMAHPVGEMKPNELGLYDMSGNVWEWCQDWYDTNYYVASPKDNPRGPNTGASGVLRGGSWSDSPSFSRVANRYDIAPEDARSYIGFRLALDR